MGPATRGDNIPDVQRELFIINGLAETISIINPETQELYNDVLTTGKWPNHLYFYDGKLYVTNSGDNEIVVYNEDSFEKEGEIYLGSGTNPWMIIQPEGTTTGYVPNFAASEVAVVDLGTYSVTNRIPVGEGPEGGVYHDGEVYVCNTNWDYQQFGYNNGTVSVIDTHTEEVVKTITVGKNPQAALAFPTLDEVHIICTGNNGGEDADDGEIHVIATTDYSVKQVLAIGGSPVGSEAAIQRDKQLVFLAGVGGVMSYNYASKQIVHGSDNYLLSASDVESDFYSGLVVDEENSLIFCSFFSQDKILVLDLETYEVVERLEGSDGTQSIYLFEE